MQDQTRNMPKSGINANPYYIFSLLFFLYMFDYIDRLVVSSLFPYLKADWGLSDTQCGGLISAVYWSILIFSFPISILIDRWSRKLTIGIMALLWSLATAAAALTHNFFQLALTRSIIGVGEAGYAPGGTAMISAIFPENRRSFMIGLWNAAIPLGSLVGVALGGFIATHYGWRYAFGLVAFPGMFIALLFFFIRDYKTISLIKNSQPTSADNLRNASDSPRPSMSKQEIVQEFVSKKSLIFSNLAFAANNFLLVSLLTWLPSYFHRTEGLDMAKAGIKGGLVMFMAILGAPLGGFITDRWIQKRSNARLLFPALSSLFSALCFFIAFGLLQHQAQYLMLLVGGIAGIAFSPGAAAVTQDVIHPGLRAISYSLCVIIQNLLGSSLGPIFTGFLSDHFGLLKALTVLPLFGILAALLFFIGSFFYDYDRSMVTPIAIELENDNQNDNKS